MGFERELIQAIRMAEDGYCDEAVSVIEGIAQAYPSDFRPWWAIAHLCGDVEKQRTALERVLALQPELHEARELLAGLNSSAN
jgi:hypothetical protein